MSADTDKRLSEQTQWLHLLLLHLCGRRVRARVEVEDLVQEVFLRVLSSPSPLPEAEAGELPLRRFLARVARSCVIDVLRAIRAKKRSAAEVRLTRADWSAPGLRESQVQLDAPGPETRAIQSEEQQELLHAFEKLPSEYQRVIGLRQLEGLSARDAAQRMGRSEAAVHSLYRRALEAWSKSSSGNK